MNIIGREDVAVATKAVPDLCAIGKVDDGTLRMCCSTHQHILCAHHYAVTHFVEVAPEFAPSFACNARRAT